MSLIDLVVSPVSKNICSKYLTRLGLIVHLSCPLEAPVAGPFPCAELPAISSVPAGSVSGELVPIPLPGTASTGTGARDGLSGSSYSSPSSVAAQGFGTGSRARADVSDDAFIAGMLAVRKGMRAYVGTDVLAYRVLLGALRLGKAVWGLGKVSEPSATAEQLRRAKPNS